MALAALEGVPQWASADEAAATLNRAAWAPQYLAPDGILPRMRLIACGWLKPGDQFRRPDDAGWREVYRYDLWPQLGTYVDQLEKSGVTAPMTFDDTLASGDIGAITQAMEQTVRELQPVLEAPCPKWLVPTQRGQLPLLNPECLKKPLKKIVDKLKPPASSSSTWWLWLIAIAYLVGRHKR